MILISINIPAQHQNLYKKRRTLKCSVFTTVDCEVVVVHSPGSHTVTMIN